MPGSHRPTVPIPIDSSIPPGVGIRAAMWPTMSLTARERWFDELYIWTEGFQASTMQRARYQINGLRKAFLLLEQEHVRKIGVTLSFGTIERCLDLVTEKFDTYQLLSHRITVLLRGHMHRVRSPYRIQSFIDWLRSQQIPIGYLLSAPRVGMEMEAVEFLRPDFAKMMAPPSSRVEYWNDTLLEARAAGLNPLWIVVGGLENTEQVALARSAGFVFGQGSALRPAYEPPSTRRAAETADAIAAGDIGDALGTSMLPGLLAESPLR